MCDIKQFKKGIQREEVCNMPMSECRREKEMNSPGELGQQKTTHSKTSYFLAQHD